MTDEQVKVIVAAILLGSDKIARACVSRQGSIRATPVTDRMAGAQARILFREVLRGEGE